MSHAASFYQDLLRYVTGRLAETEGIAVTQVDRHFPRTDSPGVFEEGRVFSGFARVGPSEACVTVPASPYLRPTISLDQFTAAVQQFFPTSLATAGLTQGQEMSEHLIVWWRPVNRIGGREDFIGLFALSPSERASRCAAISEQASKAVRLISSLGGSPTITGSWGHGLRVDQARLGLTRGIPTNVMGHLHVVSYRDDPANTTLERGLAVRESLDFIAPWNYIVYSHLRRPITSFVEAAVNEYLRAGEILGSVTAYRRRVHHPSGAVAHEEGFLVDFSEALDLERLLACCTYIAGRLESVYQYFMANFMASVQVSPDLHLRRPTQEQLLDVSLRAGFTPANAKIIARFMSRLRPTLGQLRVWAEKSPTADARSALEDLVESLAERNRRLASRHVEGDLRYAILVDTYTEPEDPIISLTWPVHFSACFAVDAYRLDGDKILVREFKLFVGIASTTSATERYLGTFVRRA